MINKKIVLCILLIFLLAFITRLTPILRTGFLFDDDSKPTLFLIKYIVNHGSILSSTAQFPSYFEGSIAWWYYAYSKLPGIQIMVSSVSLLTGISPTETSLYVYPLISSLIVVFYYIFVKLVTKNTQISLLSAMLLLIAHEVTTMSYRLHYESPALVLFFLPLYFYLKSGITSKKRYLILAGISFFAITIVHHLTSFINLLFLITIFLTLLIYRIKEGRNIVYFVLNHTIFLTFIILLLVFNSNNSVGSVIRGLIMNNVESIIFLLISTSITMFLFFKFKLYVSLPRLAYKLFDKKDDFKFRFLSASLLLLIGVIALFLLKTYYSYIHYTLKLPFISIVQTMIGDLAIIALIGFGFTIFMKNIKNKEQLWIFLLLTGSLILLIIISIIIKTTYLTEVIRRSIPFFEMMLIPIAAYGLKDVLNKISIRKIFILSVSLGLFISISIISIYPSYIWDESLRKPNTPYYSHHPSELNSMAWIKANTDDASIFATEYAHPLALRLGTLILGVAERNTAMYPGFPNIQVPKYVITDSYHNYPNKATIFNGVSLNAMDKVYSNKDVNIYQVF